MPTPDFLPTLWQTSLSFLYSEEYINSLINLLNQYQAKKILDASCGTGYPSIRLKKAGFDIVGTDASLEMLNLFKENLDKEGVTLPYYQLDWRNLSKLKKTFDFVLCRGNSFIYLDSWDNGRRLNPESFLSQAGQALAEMYKVLKRGGHLYIDMPGRAEYESGPEVMEDLGEKEINGRKVKLTWKINHDWNKRIRQIESVRESGGQVYKHTYYSFLLKHEEMKQLLEKVGFRQIKEINLPGETGYQIFLAEK